MIKNLNGKINKVIRPFINLYKNKMFLELNNNNKKITIKFLKPRLTNFNSKSNEIIQLFIKKLKLLQNF